MSSGATVKSPSPRLPALTVYAINGVVPVVDPAAFVHPTAVLIGDVVIGPNCYIGPNASIRGDFGRIIIGPGVNIQDSCCVHSRNTIETTLEEDCHVGHGAVVHACVLRRNVLVGMNSTVMDFAEIGESAIVAANAFVKAKDQVAPGTLVAGVPARFVRDLSANDLAQKVTGTGIYHQLAQRSLETMTATAPLTVEEPGRPRMKFEESGRYIKTE